MENEILVDEMERRTTKVSSYSNTDVDEEYISDTQEARNTNFTSTSSNITPLQDLPYYDDNYNFWNFPSVTIEQLTKTLRIEKSAATSLFFLASSSLLPHCSRPPFGFTTSICSGSSEF
ncbi:hypothetical protein LXL04_003899 [Taraxacum kok-saghyz]